MAKQVEEFVSILLNAQTQAHILHLQTSSYANHKTLNAFYEAIGDLADSYIETYQGKYGIITNYVIPGSFDEGDASILPYFTNLEQYVANAAKFLPKDPDLVNIHADVLAAIHRTLYKLRFLK